MAPRTYLVSAVGCKVNQYEAQQLREVLESAGYQPCCEPGQPPDGDPLPDLAVVNTCAVTRTAARKSRQLVRRASHGGRTPVIVVGCAAAAEPERYRQIDGVVAVVRHDDDLAAQLSRILDAAQNQRPYNELSAVTQNPSTAAGGRVCDRRHQDGTASAASPSVGATPSGNRSITTKAPETGQVKWVLRRTIRRLHGHQRAFLKVQDGCDAACTYCIIPRVRPRLASKPVDVAVREAADLVAAGHREIVVTGIFLGAYGRASARLSRHAAGPAPLAELLDALARVPGLLRVRLSSLEPGDVTDALLDVMARHPTCVPHLHLPAQAGADAVLKRMNRQYRIDAYLSAVDRVRRRLDRPAITTDLIVGFPGETDDDFERTLELVDGVGFARVHAFPFSLRPGTAAERWRDQQLPHDVVRDRMRRLQTLADHAAQVYRQQFIGQTERVIVESPDPSAVHHAWQGRTDRYFPVTFPAPAEPDLRGRVADVTINAADPDGVVGTLGHVQHRLDVPGRP